MGDPSESIANAFEAEANELDKLARTATAMSSKHEGARDMLSQLSKGLGQIMETAKDEANADTSLNDETRTIVISAVAKAIKRTGAAISKAHTATHNLIYLAQGQSKAYAQQADDLRKKASLRRETAKINQESIDNAFVKPAKKPAKKRASKKKAK